MLEDWMQLGNGTSLQSEISQKEKRHMLYDITCMQNLKKCGGGGANFIETERNGGCQGLEERNGVI